LRDRVDQGGSNPWSKVPGGLLGGSPAMDCPLFYRKLFRIFEFAERTRNASAARYFMRRDICGKVSVGV
jgi:hypothetical protein